MNEVEMLWDALWPGPGKNPYPLKKEEEMENKTYEDGVKDERARLIAYLIEKDILREAMFYPGYVAMNTTGTTGIDLSLTLGANNE